MLVKVDGTAGACGIGRDTRFKAWGKVIRGATDIALSGTGAYALGGGFVNWGSTVALAPGDFLVLASETGSRASRSYDYALVMATHGGAVTIPNASVRETVAASALTDQIKASAANNTLYCYAAYASLSFTQVKTVEPAAVLAATLAPITIGETTIAYDVADQCVYAKTRGRGPVKLSLFEISDAAALLASLAEALGNTTDYREEPTPVV